MLTDAILQNYIQHIDRLTTTPTLTQEYFTASNATGAGPAIFSLSFENFMANPQLYQQEVFGPSTIVVKCNHAREFLSVAKVLGMWIAD
jgi:hypothetical protein